MGNVLQVNKKIKKEVARIFTLGLEKLNQQIIDGYSYTKTSNQALANWITAFYVVSNLSYLAITTDPVLLLALASPTIIFVKCIIYLLYACPYKTLLPFHTAPLWICPFLLSNWQRSVTNWWSSSVVLNSSRNPGYSCCRTCRTSSAARPSCSWSTLEAWTNWLSASPPRYAPPGNTSTLSGYCRVCVCVKASLCLVTL